MIKYLSWKFIAVIAVLAMAVSMFSGGLGGVSFGELSVRALVSGAVFALLAVVMNLVLVRFFPELLQSGTDDSDGLGGNVDILMESGESESPAESFGMDDEGLEGVSVGNSEQFAGEINNLDIDEDKVLSKRQAGPMNDADPEEIARAIHTVLERDAKG